VLFWKPQLRSRLAFEVELDKHSGLVADNAAIVTGFDDDDLRRNEVARAAVLEGHVYFPASKKSYMRMRAEFGADVRLDVARPMEADGIDRALHTSFAGVNYVELDAAELLMLGSGN
jgi:hypothetical protein